MIVTTKPRSIGPDQYVLADRRSRFEVVRPVDAQTRPWYAAMCVIAEIARLTGAALRGMCRLCANPGYFELDRQPRAALQLGAGMIWESDSLWPMEVLVSTHLNLGARAGDLVRCIREDAGESHRVPFTPRLCECILPQVEPAPR